MPKALSDKITEVRSLLKKEGIVFSEYLFREGSVSFHYLSKKQVKIKVSVAAMVSVEGTTRKVDENDSVIFVEAEQSLLESGITLSRNSFTTEGSLLFALIDSMETLIIHPEFIKPHLLSQASKIKEIAGTSYSCYVAGDSLIELRMEKKGLRIFVLNIGNEWKVTVYSIPPTLVFDWNEVLEPWRVFSIQAINELSFRFIWNGVSAMVDKAQDLDVWPEYVKEADMLA